MGTQHERRQESDQGPREEVEGWPEEEDPHRRGSLGAGGQDQRAQGSGCERVRDPNAGPALDQDGAFYSRTGVQQWASRSIRLVVRLKSEACCRSRLPTSRKELAQGLQTHIMRYGPGDSNFPSLVFDCASSEGVACFPCMIFCRRQ